MSFIIHSLEMDNGKLKSFREHCSHGSQKPPDPLSDKEEEAAKFHAEGRNLKRSSR
jgi:hypothetical protein